MEASFLTQIMLPAVLGLIMFGMGLSLTKEDFLRLWRIPKPVFVGLFGQLLLLPFIAYAIAVAFDLSAPLAIGLIILAACPGGTMSNVISHLAKANLALSVTLTAITTVVCVFSTPFIIRLAIAEFAEASDQSFSLWSTTIGLVFVTLVPVLVGIAVRHKYAELAIRSEVFFRRFSGLFMLFMIVAILIQERGTLMDSFTQMFGATLALNLVAIAVGVLLARLFRLSARDSVTLGIEVGIQNASMAMLIALTFLQTPAYATSAGVYGLTMYIGAGLLVYVAKLVAKKS
jgi:BASS family bile acid:Na+ symporter